MPMIYLVFQILITWEKYAHVRATTRPRDARANDKRTTEFPRRQHDTDCVRVRGFSPAGKNPQQGLSCSGGARKLFPTHPHTHAHSHKHAGAHGHAHTRARANMHTITTRHAQTRWTASGIRTRAPVNYNLSGRRAQHLYSAANAKAKYIIFRYRGERYARVDEGAERPCTV